MSFDITSSHFIGIGENAEFKKATGIMRLGPDNIPHFILPVNGGENTIYEGKITTAWNANNSIIKHFPSVGSTPIPFGKDDILYNHLTGGIARCKGDGSLVYENGYQLESYMMTSECEFIVPNYLGKFVFGESGGSFGSNIDIGDDVSIGNNIDIGDNVSIGSGVVINTTDTDNWNSHGHGNISNEGELTASTHDKGGLLFSVADTGIFRSTNIQIIDSDQGDNMNLTIDGQSGFIGMGRFETEANEKVAIKIKNYGESDYYYITRAKCEQWDMASPSGHNHDDVYVFKSVFDDHTHGEIGNDGSLISSMSSDSSYREFVGRDTDDMVRSTGYNIGFIIDGDYGRNSFITIRAKSDPINTMDMGVIKMGLTDGSPFIYLSDTPGVIGEDFIINVTKCKQWDTVKYYFKEQDGVVIPSEFIRTKKYVPGGGEIDQSWFYIGSNIQGSNNYIAIGYNYNQYGLPEDTGVRVSVPSLMIGGMGFTIQHVNNINYFSELFGNTVDHGENDRFNKLSLQKEGTYGIPDMLDTLTSKVINSSTCLDVGGGFDYTNINNAIRLNGYDLILNEPIEGHNGLLINKAGDFDIIRLRLPSGSPGGPLSLVDIYIDTNDGTITTSSV